MGYNAAVAMGYSIGENTMGSTLSPLKGKYWTSTELNSLNAYALDITGATSYGFLTTGSPVSGYSKSATYSVRAFRQVRINQYIPRWSEEWEPAYLPDNIDLEPWNGNNWIYTTSIDIDLNPLKTESQFAAIFDWNGLQIRYATGLTFSNTIYTTETILASGVCWATNSVPTTSNSTATFTSSLGNKRYVNISNFTAPNVALNTTIENMQTILPVLIHVYLIAYVTTSTGTYYSSNSNFPLGATFTSHINGVDIVKQYPRNCYTLEYGYIDLNQLE